MKKVALVTGSRRGIGFGIAESLAREGFSLTINGLGPVESAAGAVQALEKLGAEVLYVPADISRAEDRERLIAETRRRFGALHVLVNNAGVAPLVRADILEAGEESFERVMRINLQGPYFLTQAAARWMIEQQRTADPAGGYPAGQHCIVTVSSVSAEAASVNRGEYCLSKAGLSMATKLWAARLAEYGIGVYEIQPGIIRTDMTAGVREKYDRLIAEGLVPQRRWGFPEDVGRAAVMLARGDLPYSTGQVIRVDGGQLIPRL